MKIATEPVEVLTKAQGRAWLDTTGSLLTISELPDNSESDHVKIITRHGVDSDTAQIRALETIEN